MSDISDQRLPSLQLPPIHLSQRSMTPASIPSLSESQTADSMSTVSLSESAHVSYGKSRASPPMLHRESTRDRRISAACTACKKRKSKCTGGPPPCKLCRISGIDCVINESLDGRRKLAAKRVQDELQQHKALLDGLIEGLGSAEKSDKILELIRSRASLAALSDFILQPSNTNNYESRTRVPIELLIQAEEVLSQQMADGEQQHTKSGDSTASPPSRYLTSPQSGASGGPPLRSYVSYPGASGDDSHQVRDFVQVLHDSPEPEASHWMQELRRSGDISLFMQEFGRAISSRNRTASPNHVS